MTIDLRKAKSESGFTLVELAIVMIIVGLLIGGILKGQELIGNARITATTTQLKSIDSATNTFRDMYKGFPGDLINAPQRLRNCAAGTQCGNAPAANLGDMRIQTAPDVAMALNTEALAFWAQLNAADLLGGMTGLTGAAPAFGVDAPSAEVGGGLRVGYSAGGAGVLTGTSAAAVIGSGHYIALAQTPAAIGTGIAMLNPVQAATIDRKLDDGAPDTGIVYGSNDGAGAGCMVAAGGNNIYQESVGDTDCVIYFRFQN